MWKLQNNKLPKPNTKPFKINHHSHNTRQNADCPLQIPSVRLNIAKHHTSYQGPLLRMNDIPPKVKLSKSLKSFSNNHKKYLLENLI